MTNGAIVLVRLIFFIYIICIKLNKSQVYQYNSSGYISFIYKIRKNYLRYNLTNITNIFSMHYFCIIYLTLSSFLFLQIVSHRISYFYHYQTRLRPHVKACLFISVFYYFFLQCKHVFFTINSRSLMLISPGCNITIFSTLLKTRTYIVYPRTVVSKYVMESGAAVASGGAEKMRVMVAIDDSDESFYALQWVLDNLLNQDQANHHLTIIHVMEPLPHYVYPNPGVHIGN